MTVNLHSHYHFEFKFKRKKNLEFNFCEQPRVTLAVKKRKKSFAMPFVFFGCASLLIKLVGQHALNILYFLSENVSDLLICCHIDLFILGRGLSGLHGKYDHVG